MRVFSRRKLAVLVILVPIAWACFTALSARMKGKRPMSGIDLAQVAIAGSVDGTQDMDFLENRIAHWRNLERTMFDAQIRHEEEIGRLELEELHLTERSREAGIEFEAEVKGVLERIANATKPDVRDRLIRKVREGGNYSDRIAVVRLELIDLRRKVDQEKSEVKSARRERVAWIQLEAGPSKEAMRPHE